jgi:hypothetical protein
MRPGLGVNYSDRFSLTAARDQFLKHVGNVPRIFLAAANADQADFAFAVDHDDVRDAAHRVVFGDLAVLLNRALLTARMSVRGA